MYQLLTRNANIVYYKCVLIKKMIWKKNWTKINQSTLLRYKSHTHTHTKHLRYFFQSVKFLYIIWKKWTLLSQVMSHRHKLWFHGKGPEYFRDLLAALVTWSPLGKSSRYTGNKDTGRKAYRSSDFYAKTHDSVRSYNTKTLGPWTVLRYLCLKSNHWLGVTCQSARTPSPCFPLYNPIICLSLQESP